MLTVGQHVNHIYAAEKAILNMFICSIYTVGRSINMKSAGIIGRSGPQSKQPFLVAFFKASEVLLRSVRATGGKRKNPSRNKGRSQPKTSQASRIGGMI